MSNQCLVVGATLEKAREAVLGQKRKRREPCRRLGKSVPG